MNIQGWFPLGLTDFISFLSKWTLKSLLQHHSSKASVLWCSAFFMVQLSHPYMTTEKTIAFTIQTLSAKWCLRFLIFCLGLSQLFFQGASVFNFKAAVTVCSDFGAQENKVCHCFHFSPSIYHEVMRLDALILVFWMLSFKPAFSLSSFTFIKRFFSSSSLSAIRRYYGAVIDIKTYTTHFRHSGIHSLCLEVTIW